MVILSGLFIYTSSNGLDWSSYEYPMNTPGGYASAILYGDEGIIIIFSALGSSNIAVYDFYTSLDFKKWTQRKTKNLTINANFLGSCYGNKTYIVPGFGYNDTFFRLKPFSYDTVNQFFIAENPHPIPNVENYIKAI